MTVMEEEVLIHSSLEAQGLACHVGPREEAPGQPGGRRSEGKAQKSTFIVASAGNGKTKQIKRV